jgi:hypothetical protein
VINKKLLLTLLISIFLLSNVSAFFFKSVPPPPSPLNPNLDYNWTGHNIFHNITIINYTGINSVNQSDYWGSYHYSLANINEWDEAFSWGNHSDFGYLKSYNETDPLYQYDKEWRGNCFLSFR